MADPTFFASATDFRSWLQRHHDSADELVVGFWKKGTGKQSIDWPQARDQALCFGWIDGIRKSRDEESYTIRFTPRRKGSEWSRVNIERFAALTAAGQMTEAGARAYEAGKLIGRSVRDAVELTEEELARFKAERKAWQDFEARPPGYRRAVLRWVTDARKPETRARRLETLIGDSAAGRKLAGFDIARKK